MSRMKAAKEALLGSLTSVVRELVPGGRVRGRIYEARNPAREDRKIGSFIVWLKGGAPGAWKDYATGEQGDIIDLIALSLGCSRAEALRWAEKRTGLDRASAQERAALAHANRKKTERAARVADLEDERMARRAGERWQLAQPIGAHVERYFASRGIPLDEVEGLEDSFRFEPSAEWWRGASRLPDGTRIPGPHYPALVSAMRDGGGRIRARHFTFLAPDGRGKAPVEKPKLMFPRTEGLVIRVTRQDGMTPEEATAKGASGPLIITEGIEDALTLALACPGFRIWAAGSLPGLLHVPDHPCASAYVVAQDNDWDKPQALLLFERACQRLKATGKPVSIIRAQQGKDFNDELNGKG